MTRSSCSRQRKTSVLCDTDELMLHWDRVIGNDWQETGNRTINMAISWPLSIQATTLIEVQEQDQHRGDMQGPQGIVEENAVEVLCLMISLGLVSRKKMQLVCLKTCNLCRRCGNWSVSLTQDNVAWLHHQLQRDVGSDRGDDRVGGDHHEPSRLAHYHKIAKLLYNIQEPISEATQWPANLKVLSFGWMFDYPLVSLPSTLRELTIGSSFNHQVEDVGWPSGLVKLRFGRKFNRPVELVSWPAGLRTLVFGENFDQPVEDMTWPPALRYLVFGAAFNHPVERVVWGEKLERLEFGRCFNQPVYHLRWPRSLRDLSFGHLFNYPLHPYNLPAGLRRLRYSNLHDQDESVTRELLPPGCVLDVYKVELETWHF